MTGPSSKALRAAEYRNLAHQASVLAQGAALEHVRAKHQRALESWTALADLAERPAPVVE